ncbi:MAG: hypothetical protein ABW318_21580 [Vicinamibacterales bacterium]
MTAHSLDHERSLPTDILARFDRGPGLEEQSLALVDETVALRRCALYRNAFKGTAVSYPAELLGCDVLAAWIRRQGVTVDVTTAAELERATAHGIDPMHIVVHPHGRAVATIRHAVNAGVGRFVVDSSHQIGFLDSSADQIQRVVIDATDGDVGTLAQEAVAHRALHLIGLHCRLEADDAIGAVQLRRLIAEMASFRRDHGVLLTRISLAGLDVGERCLDPRILRRIAEAIGEVVGDACAQYRFPRPALTLSPSRHALLPA